MDIDRGAWSGDGDFTTVLMDALQRIEQVAVVRVQDAPASRAEVGYSFICNDVFVGFRRQRALSVRRVLGVLPVPVVVHRPSLTLAGLERRLSADGTIGAADYRDDGMIQYLRAERVRAAYQARAQKLVEVVRIYEAHAADDVA
jgi:hypothetical protein